MLLTRLAGLDQPVTGQVKIGRYGENPVVDALPKRFRLNLQIAGYPFDVDDLVVRGDPQSGRFAVFHLKENLVQAVEALNSPPEFMMGTNLIGGRRPVNKGRLADISIPMTEVAE